MHCKSPVRGVARVPGRGLLPTLLRRTAVRNRGHCRRLGVGRVRRKLRVDERAGGGAQLKIGDVAAEKISGEKKVIRRWVDAHGHRLNPRGKRANRSEEHTSELQSRQYLVCG